jgi:hypothetical protein
MLFARDGAQGNDTRQQQHKFFHAPERSEHARACQEVRRVSKQRRGARLNAADTTECPDANR